MLRISVQQCGLPGLNLLCEAALLNASYLVLGYLSAIRHPLTAIVVDVISDVLWLPRHSFSSAACSGASREHIAVGRLGLARVTVM